MTATNRYYEFVSIDPHDVDAIREWAELRCQGWTLERLAASVGVEPSFEAVGAYLSRSLPPETSKIVIEVCKRDLRSEKTKPD